MTSTDTTSTADPPANFRDLGGLPVENGTVRPGLIFRSDDVSTAPAAWAADAVHVSELRCVIDLRSPQEVSLLGRGPLAGYGSVTYHHLPLIEVLPRSEAMAELRNNGTASDVGLFYLGMLEDGAAQLATALTLVASSAGATVFHCAAGKDRTGLLAAVLLTALGATADTIVADYAASRERLPAILRRVGPAFARLSQDDDKAERTPARSALLDAEPATITTMLAAAHERHGGLLGPLRDAGLGDDTLERLRHRLVEPPRPSGQS